MTKDAKISMADFWKRFNLKPDSSYSRLRDLDFDRVDLNTDKFVDENGKGLRELILDSERRDFQWLLDTVGEVDRIQEKLFDRFRIDARNTFSGEVTEIYVRLLMATQDLRDLLSEKQISFYQKRIQEIEEELAEINSKKTLD